MSDANGSARMQGKRAIITGASSGIGEATAKLFVREGGRVALVARRGEVLEQLAGELEGVGGHAVALVADIADPEQVSEMVVRAVDHLGGLDVLVNCAGIVDPLALPELNSGRWHETIETNLSGSFYLAREAASVMLAAGSGTIILVGSELSVLGMPMYAAYCASKAGVLGLVRALAAELAPTVTVNAVCPGPIDTPMLRAEFELSPDPQGARDQTIARVPLKRLGRAEEIAVGILYLAVEASYATGTTLELDGGATFV
jgi:NAD(P)-dependent dehydrogenase (short-subunit alcohol dehydrogenase family)